MKLYLSSFKIGDNPNQLSELVGKNRRTIYISNGLDFAKPEEQKKHQESDMRELQEIGLDPELIDLRDYFGKAAELEEKLRDVGVIYVSGGNVYDLRIAMEQSGFDNFLRKQAETDLVYAGYSAAVCVLSPTLRGYHIVDNPDNRTYGDYETNWDGLGILGWQFAPHFNSDHSESAGINKEIAYYEENELPYKALRDGEVIIQEW